MKNSLYAHFRQRLIKGAESQGVAEAAIRYHISRKTVHKWLKRYDGTLASLEDTSTPSKGSHRVRNRSNS